MRSILLAGGLALILFFRDRGWHWAGGLIAALAFCYGASMAWRIQHIGQVLSLAYLPFALLCLDRPAEVVDEQQPLLHAAAHRLAGEEAGQVAGQGARRPQVVGLGQHAYAAQIQLAVAAEGFAPTSGHVGDGFRGAGQGAVQGVLGAAVDDALGFHALPAAEAGILHQQAGIAELAQARMQPETGDTAADDQHVRGKGLGHSV